MHHAVKPTPLTADEQAFAAENHDVIVRYLNANRLNHGDYYDVAAMGYLQAVKKWFARPELHRWSFRTVAWNSIRTGVGNARRKAGMQLETVSLDDIIPGTDGLTWAETVTADNLNLFYTGGKDVNISYNVTVPERGRRIGAKSDETKAFDSFRESAMKNMCIGYDAEEEAKRKIVSLRAYNRKFADKDDYELFRDGKSVYVVRKQKGKK